jgi:hypothetical protein
MFMLSLARIETSEMLVVSVDLILFSVFILIVIVILVIRPDVVNLDIPQ